MIDLLGNRSAHDLATRILAPELERLIFSALRLFEPQALTIEGVLAEVQAENPDYTTAEINSTIGELVAAHHLEFDMEDYYPEPDADPETVTVLKINHPYREQ